MNQQKFWKDFFELRAKNYHNLSNYSLNGFVDPIQTSTIRESILKIIQSVNPEIVFDFGCGDGYISSLLKRFCSLVYGIEISKSMAELARKRGISTLNDTMLSALDKKSKLNDLIHERENKQTLLLFCESLVCIEMPNQLIKNVFIEFNRFGYLLVSCSNSNSIFRKLLRAPATERLSKLNINELLQDAKNSGFFITKIGYIISIPRILSKCIFVEYKVNNRILKKILNVISNNQILLLERRGAEPRL